MSGDSKVAQAFALGSYFLSGCLAINTSQVLGAPLYLVNEDWYNTWISFTKQSFNLLTITLTQWWAPTTVRVSGDPSMRGQLFKSVEGTLICNFPERLILIANHQIYTDWLYLWWIAYCGGAAGRVYIVLKESLKRIPVIGWGIQLSQFILLKRNWEKDKPHLSKHLQKLNNADPMWLLLFPEGTNLAPNTRESSKKWAEKNSIPDMQHTLQPRTTGLQFCIQELSKTVGFVYDCTIAYEGVPRGEYAQDIYTLQSQYLGGKPPTKVHMYWRRFRVSDIPFDNTKPFESWLRARWIEKDAYIEHFYRTGQMPCDRGTTTMPDGKKRKGCGYIETTIRAQAWHEFLQVFAPIGVLSLVLYSLYNQLPKDFVESVNGLGKKAIMDQVSSLGENLSAQQKTITTYPGGPTVTLNSNKISNKQAAGIMHKVTKQLTAQKPEGLNAVLPSRMSSNPSTVRKGPATASAVARRGSLASLPARPKPPMSNASMKGWDTASTITTRTNPKPLVSNPIRKPSVVPSAPMKKVTAGVESPAPAVKKTATMPTPSKTAPKSSGTTPAKPHPPAKKLSSLQTGSKVLTSGTGPKSTPAPKLAPKPVPKLAAKNVPRPAPNAVGKTTPGFRPVVKS